MICISWSTGRSSLSVPKRSAGGDVRQMMGISFSFVSERFQMQKNSNCMIWNVTAGHRRHGPLLRRRHKRLYSLVRERPRVFETGVTLAVLRSINSIQQRTSCQDRKALVMTPYVPVLCDSTRPSVGHLTKTLVKFLSVCGTDIQCLLIPSWAASRLWLYWWKPMSVEGFLLSLHSYLQWLVDWALPSAEQQHGEIFILMKY